MFDVGFSEVLLIFVIALVVLGPEKLPRLASQVGRWVGRARAMARQFREQLEEEVNLEEVRKAHSTPPPPANPAPDATAGTSDTASATSQTQPAASESHPAASESHPAASESHSAAAQLGNGPMPDPEDFRADTFSHAHPTNEYGANPLTPNGAPEPAATPAEAPHAEAPQAMPQSPETSTASVASAPSIAHGAESSSGATPAGSSTHNPERPSGTGAYAGAAAPTTADEPRHS